MRHKPIINHMSETDSYKISMGQAIYEHFPEYMTTWTFKCRNEDVFFTPEMVQEIREQWAHYCTLRWTKKELDYLRKLPWIKPAYVEYLRIWRPNYDDVCITTDAECGLSIEATGTWLNTSMYEIPILAIVNEVYFRMAYNYDELFESFKENLENKLILLESGEIEIGAFSEFGLRRRLSAEAQDLVVRMLAARHFPGSTFVGTSNIWLAIKYGVTAVGTMAHEWIMCAGQGNHKHNPAYSNYYALRAWVDTYGVRNGIALTDTITTDVFLEDFDLYFATVFSGVRHDSGDPIEWGEKMIAHYKSLGIDPMTKTLLFSDSLRFKGKDGKPGAAEIYAHFKGRAKVAFGIGTYLSNDTKVPALNIVMKTTKCNGDDVAKISDVTGKGMCKNPEYVSYLNRSLQWRLNHSKKTEVA